MDEVKLTTTVSWTLVGVVLVAMAGCSQDDNGSMEQGITAGGGAGVAGVAGVSGAAGVGGTAGVVGAPIAGSAGVAVAGVGGAPLGGMAGVPMAGMPGVPMAGTAGAPLGGMAGVPMAGVAGAPMAGMAGVPMAGEAGMMAGAGGSDAPGGGCTPAPSGDFPTMLVTGTGPGGNYTIARPTTLGEGGFLHPPVAWGNGLATTPSLYVALLENLASQGFVVIANPGTGSDPTVVRQGLEWLIEQNGSGDYAGKLAVDCAGTIGYSMGGGAAVGSGAHPAVKAIVSMHGLQDAAENASGPILLTTSEGDTFVTKTGFVAPCYERSRVQPTILASHPAGDHLDPIGDGGMDAAPAVAWLRYWLYGDQAQREWFFGDSCTLCSWPDFRRKNLPEWD